MSGTAKATRKHTTLSRPSESAPPKAKSASGAFQLHNDTNSHVSVVWSEWGSVIRVLTLASGTTSDSWPLAGDDGIWILYIDSEALTQAAWDGSGWIVWYDAAGSPANGVNKVSAFH